MPISTSLRLEYAGLRIRARSTEPSHLSWLDAFLSPWFTPAGERMPGGFEMIVALDCDGRRRSRLLAAPPPSDHARGIDTFVLDSRVVRHLLWFERHGERVIVDDDRRVFYRVSRRHPHVRILAGDDLVATRVALMRVVRELAMAHAQRAGRLLLHAAALEIDGRAIGIVGPKRAGKTTLLLHLLRAQGSRFIANDRVFVDVGGSVPYTTGLPSIVALRPGTLDLFPDLRARVADRGHAFWLTPTEARAAAERRLLTEGTDMTPAQLCDLAGVEATAGAPLAALVFPHVDVERRERGAGLSLEPIPPGILERRLRAHLLAGEDGERQSAVFRSPWSGGGAEIAPDTWCRTLARAVPAFDCRLGPDSLAELDVEDLFAQAGRRT